MNVKKSVDVAIIGGGIGGIMTAYRLLDKNPELSVMVIERGHEIRKRICPMLTKKTDHCVKCATCAIMEGMAGAGAFSDGKYVISTEYGGWLTEFLEPETVIDYIEQADDILVKFGATTERFMPNNELKLECLKYDLHMAQAQLKHLGTDSNFETMKKLIDDLGTRCDIITDTEVTGVDKDTRELTMVHNGEEFHTEAKDIIFAV